MTDQREVAANIVDSFKYLMSYLNGEDNDLAGEFLVQLKEFVGNAYDDRLWLDCLEGAGVDNWEGYDYAQDAYKQYTDQED